MLKFCVFIFVLLCANSHAVDYISQQDTARILAFSKDNNGDYLLDRSEERARPYTQRISGRLTDHTQIDYGRSATESERETIYKAMMGSVIVHGSSSYQKTTYGHAGYNSHFDALQIIDESIRVLWQSIQQGKYIHSFDQVSALVKHQALLTTHFIKWFYESLESYRHELNFFGGAATFEWFQQACHQHRAGRVLDYDLGKEYSTNREGVIHIHVHDANGFKVAILKPKESTERNDWIVSLAAKAIGLVDVINPAIPVRIQEGNFIIDPKCFTHILEPFVGVHSDQISVSSPMGRLLRNVLSQDSKQTGKKSHTFMQDSFATYFENADIPAEQRFEDLQTFNRSIAVENLLKLISFWQVFRIRDMHGGNILWTLDLDGKFKLVAIDYNLCFIEYKICFETSLPRIQHPPLSMLLQACEMVSSSLKSSLGTASYLPFLQVLRNYDYPIPACSSKESFDSIMRGFKTGTTIRQMMHEFYKKLEKEKFDEKKLVEFKKGYPSIVEQWEKDSVVDFQYKFSFHAKVGDTVTVYDPLEVRPVDKINPELPPRSLLSDYIEVRVKGLYSAAPFESYRVRKHYDWVFSVRNIDDLQNGRFFRSTESPGDYMWRMGIINLDNILSRSYRNILPKVK